MERLNIIPLNQNNFPTWKVQVKMTLIANELFGIVSGTETAPVDAESEEHRRFSARKDKALATIVLAIESNLLYLLEDPDDPVEVWKKLNDIFQKKTWANKLRLRRKLYTLQLKSDGRLQDHMKEITEVFSELAVIGEQIKEEDKVICLLASLPDKYSTLVTTLEALDRVPTWETVKERLLHEDRKIEEKMEKSIKADHSTEALTSIEKKKKSKHVFSHSVKCYLCGKRGHMKRNCMELRSQGKKIENANSATSSSYNGTFLAASAFATSVNPSCAWILDTGATQHMCHDRDVFSNYSEFEEPIPVKMGDAKLIYGIGSGTVTLMLNIGNKVRTTTLENVLYVPKLACNLFSISRANKNGRTTEFNEKACKVYSKNRETLAVGTRKGNLYYLNCSFNSKQAYTAKLNNGHSDDYFLWHQRFCHLGLIICRN